MFFPASLAVIPTLLPAESLGAAYGLLVTAQVAGMTARPLALGLVFTGAGTVVGLEVIAAMALAGLAIAARLAVR